MARCPNCYKRFFEECTASERCPTDEEIGIANRIVHKNIKRYIGDTPLNLRNDIIEALINVRCLSNVTGIKEIKTELDYKKSLARIDELMDAKLNTPEGDELDILVKMVVIYEKEHESWK